MPFHKNVAVISYTVAPPMPHPNLFELIPRSSVWQL